MDTDLAIKLTDIVESIGTAKYEIMSEVSNCKREIALVKQKLTTHLETEEARETSKNRKFDKKTVLISISIGAVAVFAVII